ncbi:hypothetical protein JKP88DRAFT_263256 [Tribonema minus]|uniref:Uncharacterized protein n=1 Tax=Tribonema minus TaxID=303371 RepID=A0A836CDH2_9STRA|nr:hypothetical protein JKP88DRAFT_263256 [Tribonema minus]
MRLYIKAEVGVLAEECAAVREQLHQQKLQQLTIQANARRSRLGLDHSDVLPDVHDAVFGDYLTPVQKPKTLRRDARRARTLVPLVVAAAALIQPRAAAPGCGPPRADLRAAVLRFATERGAAAPGEADVAAAAAAALADALMARVELTRAMLAAGAEHVLSALTATDAAAARSALPGLAAAAAAAADPADALRNELAAADALLNDKAVARRLQDFREFRLHPGATAQGLVRFAAGRGDAAARRAELAAAMARLGTDVNEVNRCARAQQRRTQFETGAADLDADEVAAMLQLDAKLGGLALSTAMLERASADMEREYRRQVYQFGHSSKEALRVARKRLTTARRDAWVPMSCRSFSGFYDY